MSGGSAQVSFKSEMVLKSVSSLLDRLTAFVLKSFSQARSYIFVEDSHILNSLTWLSQKQKENGCFQHSGSLLNNAMKVIMPSILFWFLKRVMCKSDDALVDFLESW